MSFKKTLNTILDNSPKKNAWLVARKLFPQKFRGPFDHLEKIPRYTEAEVEILGKKIKIADVPSFLFMNNEIFRDGVYKFKAKNSRPYIIDCGANIGLSVIYFKNLYPEAEIIGFEPDPKIFSLLENNIKSFGFNNVKLLQKAILDKEAEADFLSEGADGGRLANQNEKNNTLKIKTARLRDYLDRPVDFLKIDVEGAETAVLQDCSDLLLNIQNLFVEYHSFADKPQELVKLLAILEKAGFRYYIQSWLNPIQPFCNKVTYAGFDMQLNIFACRF
jgi:FkbM family methyltransferase